MTEFGYALSSEEHSPGALVDNARKAERIGFEFAMISDHFHPWTDSQGNSPFVWGVIGAIAHATERIRLGTGVTCPTIRIHPAIVAHAAATSAVMRQLWQGGYQTHRGKHYTVENARLYTLPDEPVPIAVAAAKQHAAELAGRVGDAFVNTSPDPEPIERFERSGGQGKPKYGQITVCWAKDEDEAAQTVYEIWPNAALGGDLTYELPLPRHFEQATEKVTREQLKQELTVGPDPERYVAKADEMVEAGFTHVYFHQIGPDQEGFFRFWQDELAPRLGR